MPGHAQWHCAVSCAKMAEPIEMPFGLWTGVGQGSMCYMEVRIGETWRIWFSRPRSAALQKRLNRWQCHLGMDSGGPKELCIRWGSRSPYAKGKFLGAKTWTRVIPRKHVLSGVHTGSTWQIPLNHPCAVAMRLWPLVICVMFIWYVCFMILFIIWYLIIRCILLYVVMSAVWHMFTNQRSECHGDESWCENNEHCLWLHAGNDEMFCSYLLSFGSRPSNHYFRSVCWFVCLFVCAVFLTRLWTDFDQTWTYVICLGLVVSPRI